MIAVQLLAAFAGVILSSQVMAGSSQFGKGYEDGRYLSRYYRRRVAQRRYW